MSSEGPKSGALKRQEAAYQVGLGALSSNGGLIPLHMFTLDVGRKRIFYVRKGGYCMVLMRLGVRVFAMFSVSVIEQAKQILSFEFGATVLR